LEDETTALANQMRGRKSVANNHDVADYEYVTIPWRKGFSMEQVHGFLDRNVTRHSRRMEEVTEYQMGEYGNWDEDEDEPYVPEWCQCIDPNAPMCYYSFDISMHLNKIKWVKNDSGRQLLTGSFHPVNDKNWYQNAKLEPGTHVFYRVVLEGFDYPDDTSTESMVVSSTTVRKAVLEIFAEKDTKPATTSWYLKNQTNYSYTTTPHTRVETKPKWWGPRIVLVSAATQRQVDDLKLSLVCATPKPFERLSYERFEIVVGTEQIGQISLAQAMAQPALNRCAHCSLELLVPNRCVSVCAVL
jgi:hypothetical protein